MWHVNNVPTTLSLTERASEFRNYKLLDNLLTCPILTEVSQVQVPMLMFESLLMLYQAPLKLEVHFGVSKIDRRWMHWPMF